MIYAILSILVFTLIVWTLNKTLLIKICPICAGVSLTWLWMLTGMWLGFLSVSRYEIITAVLMGASIGGIVNELKKMFLKLREKKSGRKNKRIELLDDKLKDCC